MFDFYCHVLLKRVH